ncbi:MAG: peptide-methionine (R)-S-oxide reductase MsrB, partial [Sphingomicrobium sp.]
VNRRTLFGAAALAAIGVAFGARPAAAPAKYQVTRTTGEWRKQLGAARYNILRQEGTERPYSSPLNKEKRRGIYTCAGCDLPLFSSATKFDSGTGWPSFYAALPRAIATRTDSTLGMSRVEEHCRRCGGHLGHIFDDGPKPTGKRHCINGLSLTFRPA